MKGGSPTALERRIVGSRFSDHSASSTLKIVGPVGGERDLVGGGRVRAEPALLVPPELLGGQPAHALDEGAFDLAHVDRRVERAADVVKDVGPVDLVFAGQRVDAHFGDRRAIGEVVEGPALARRAVPVDFRRLVEAGRREVHARGIGVVDEGVEGDAPVADPHHVGREDDLVVFHRIRLDGEVDEARLDLLGGVLRRHAVEVGTGGGGGRGGVGHLGGRRRGDLHPVEVDLEAVGDHLRHLGVEALPHLGAAVVEMDRAVVIDVHQRAGLIVPGGGEADAELDRREGDALADDAAFRVVGENGGAPRLIVGGGFQLVDDAADDVVGDLLVVGREVAPLAAVEIQLADLERVLAERIGDLLDDALGDDHALRPAEAAKGGVGDRVGLQRLGGEIYIRVEIGVVGMEQRAVGDRAGEVGGKAAAGGEVAFDRMDAAVLVEADVVVDDEVVALAGRDHVLVAVGADFHGAARASWRRPRRQRRTGWPGSPCRRSRRPCGGR